MKGPYLSMYRLYTDITKEQLEEIMKWKSIADEHNLTPTELRMIGYHWSEIKKIINKDEIKKNR